MEHSYCAEYEDVLLRPLHRYDIEYLRQWRNREDLNRYLRNIGEVTPEMQEKWFSEYLKDPDIVFFAADYQRFRTVGSVALYDFRGEQCEIGKIVIGEERAQGRGLAKVMFQMAMRIGMEHLGIQRFVLCVHEDNLPARKTYEGLRFRQTGIHPFVGGGRELEMEITAEEIVRRCPEIMVFLENDNPVQNTGGGITL